MRRHDDDEMSDTEMWRAIRKRSQHRRQKNTESSAQVLAGYPQIQVDSRNNGVHLIVRYNGRTIDFWPSSGKWIDRAAPGAHHRGVFRLLNNLGVIKDENGQATG